MKYCSENNKRLIHFSTCEVYGKTIGSFLPKDSPLRQVGFFFFGSEIGIECRSVIFLGILLCLVCQFLWFERLVWVSVAGFSIIFCDFLNGALWAHFE